MIAWTVATACKQMSCSRTTLYKLLAQNRLTRVKLLGRTYVLPSEVYALFGVEPISTVMPHCLSVSKAEARHHG